MDGPSGVLVVDDEPAVADLLRDILVSRGHAVSTAATLAAAREHVDDAALDLVLLDLALPDGRGEELLQELRALPDPPEVLIVTGHATLKTAVAAVEAGTAGYLTKPFDLEALEIRIAELLERRRAAAAAVRARCARRTAARDGGHAHGRQHGQLHPRPARGVAPHLPGPGPADRRRHRLGLSPERGHRNTPAVRRLSRAEGAPRHAGRHAPAPEDQGFYLPLWGLREPVWSDDVGADPRFGHELFRRLPHQSGLLLPLVLDDAVAGAVYFAWWHARRTFAARELTLLEHVCGQLTALLKNARGWEQAQRDRERLRAINEVGRRLASVYETDDVLALIVHEAERLLGGAAAWIRLIEDDRLVVRAPVREDYARAKSIMPFALETGRLRLAMANPRDRRTIAEVEQTAGVTVAPALASGPAIQRAHLLYHAAVREMLRRTTFDEATVGAAMKSSEEQSAGDVLQRMFEYNAVARASDIHLEPYEFELLIRCRVDGVLQEVLSLPATMVTPVVARLKVLAGLRIDERRVPQDGRFDIDLAGYRIDLRMSTLPTHWGEKVVLRVQSKDSMLLDLEDLGLAATDYQVVLRNVMRPWGMILITGPTGCGKTTSLYSMLTRVGAERHNVVNISTVEDPVEYPLARVNQMPVNSGAGVEFATGLRALLRQDPDIIMVGEIRDRETAQIAVRSALVGRLLLSTLHTNDSTGAVPRLLDMGVEPFLVASTLSLIVAQRLVRRICLACRESVPADERVLGMLRRRVDFDHTTTVLQQRGALGSGPDPWGGVRFFRGTGCPQCNDSGFRGRVGVFELYEIDADARGQIMERASAAALRATALANGMTTMFQDGLAKALLGDTTVDEVFRAAL